MSKFLEPIYCPCPKVKKLDRILTRGYDSIFAQLGLTAEQFALLRRLERLGPMPIHQLAQSFAMGQSTLSRNLKTPIAKGWVSSTPDPKDGRSRVIALTKKGMTLSQKAKTIWEDEQQFLLKTLGQKKLLALNTMVEEASTLIEAARKKAET